MIFSVPISSLIAYYMSPYKPTTDVTNLNDNQSHVKLFDRKDSPCKTMRLLFALWYASHFVFENMYLKFAVTYMQYSPQQLSASKSAEIFSIATAVFTTFCGINIFLTLRIKMIKIMYCAYGAMTLGVVLLMFNQYSIIILWMSNVVICAGLAPMYAAVYAFTGEYLTFTDHVSASFMLLRAMLTLVTPIIIGIYIEQYSTIFIILETFFMACSLIIFLTIIFLIKKHGKKLPTDNIRPISDNTIRARG